MLLRTAAVGVCHSDLHFLDGAYPFPMPVVLGHEAAGVVEQVGSEVRTVKPGDHVITCLSAYCGHCEHCLTGHLSLCVEPDTKRREGEERGRAVAYINAITPDAWIPPRAPSPSPEQQPR